MIHQNQYSKTIKNALDQLRLTATDQQVDQWLNYLSLLQKWNKTYKMTTITEMDKMLTHHLFDSLSIASYLKGSRSIDVGSGGGLPGIILAILMPEHHFTLVDSVGKKVKFLNHVVYTLGLKNVTPLNIRIESYQSEQRFDNVISRAFTALDNFHQLCKHLPNETGQFLAMKGQLTGEEEKLDIEKKIISLKVPFLDAERHLVIFKHTAT